MKEENKTHELKIFTSYHAKAQQLIEMGLMPISISTMFPRFSKIKYAQYKELGPRYEMLKWDLDRYDKEFQNILSKLNAVNVHTHLTNLSMGKDIVLLCYETNFNDCHRKKVGEWIEKKLQIIVKEVNFSTPKKEVKKVESKSANQMNLF